eukprot:scaffold31588_cov64-Phaeocystis_antarctica.AAC.2
MPRPVIPCTAAVEAARGGGVSEPSWRRSSVLLIVSLSSVLAIGEVATRENTSPRPPRPCSALSPARSKRPPAELVIVLSGGSGHTLTGAMCTCPPGVKATALDRSPAVAEAPSCALLSIVGLVEVTGIVGCSGRATGDGR